MVEGKINDTEYNSWPKVGVSELVKIKSGVSPRKIENLKTSGETPYYKVDDMNYARKYMNRAKNYFENASIDLIKENSIIFPKRGASIFTNKIAITKKECLIDTNLMALEVERIDLIHHKYLYYLLLERKLFKIADVSSIPQINNKHIEELTILLPTLEEQKKITEILSIVDQQIEQTEMFIEKTKELKKGLMQQLLTKGIRHTEFKQSELGKIPSTWQVKRFKDIGTFVKGKGIAKKDLSEQGVPCILYGQLYTKYKEVINEVTNYTEIKIKNPIIGMKNDLLIPSSGETAIDIATASSLNLDNVYIGGDINLFTPIQGVNSNFLSLQINSVRKLELAKLAQGSSVYHLYANTLEDFKLALPSLEEQEEIASILSTVGEQIESYEKEKAKYEKLKKGLMQQLLTGKVRVKID